MKRLLPLAFGLFALAAVPSPGRAVWGWPPPGYSVSTGRACDGRQYRGLCAVLRDWRHRGCPGCAPASQASGGPGACCPPAGPGEPASPQLFAQPPTLGGGPPLLSRQRPE
jgi:hypothetical protein